MLFIKVAENENEESIELPIEPQGYLLMSTLIAQYPGACGLKFKTEQFSWRGVRVVEDKLYPPDEKWDPNSNFYVTYPKDSKRKGDDLDINSAKSRKIERKCVDLIVLGIPWKSTEEAVRHYFEQYGEVVLCEIKRDSSGGSKGFGFVRFKEYNQQCGVLGKKHYIDGRWCDVKIPNSQEPETSRKIFVGRLSETIAAKDLQDYFSQFGQVIDVYIPKPFRAFGFVTFVEAEIAQGLCGESHIIKGASVHVSRADPKEDDRQGGGGMGGMGGGGGGGHREPIVQSSQSMRRFPSSGTNGLSGSSGHHHGGGSAHHMSSSMSANAIGGSGSSSKTMPPRNKKFDSHGAIDMYDTRQHDIRSPHNMPPQPHHHAAHHHHNSTQGAHHGAGGAPPHQSHEQMSAMMNMFNPMIAAFMQQLASGMQPTASQSPLETHSGGAPPPALSHHHAGPPPWRTPTDYGHGNQMSTAPTSINTGIPSNGGGGGYTTNPSGGGGYNGAGSQQHNSRFKPEKF